MAFEASEPKVTEEQLPYCWISPSGVFYSVAFCEHEQSAIQFCKEFYAKESAEHFDENGVPDCDYHFQDFLTDQGWGKVYGDHMMGLSISIGVKNDKYIRPTDAQIAVVRKLIAGLKASDDHSFAYGLEDQMITILSDCEAEQCA